MMVAVLLFGRCLAVSSQAILRSSESQIGAGEAALAGPGNALK
jgi:hypothetical protein